MDRFIRNPNVTKELYELVGRTNNEGSDFYNIIDQIFNITIDLWSADAFADATMAADDGFSDDIMELLRRPEAEKLFSIIEEEFQWWRVHTHRDDKESEHWFAMAGAVIDLFSA